MGPNRIKRLIQEYSDFICALTVPAKPSWPPQTPEWLLSVSHPCLGCNSSPFPATPAFLSFPAFPAFPQAFSLRSQSFPAPHPEVPAVCWLSPGNELPVFISSLWEENNVLSLKSCTFPGLWSGMNGTSVWLFLRGASDSDPSRSQLCSRRDLWHQEKLLEMQREVQEHIPRDRGSWGGYFGKAAPGHTKGDLCWDLCRDLCWDFCWSLWMPGRGFGTSCSIINLFEEGINTSCGCPRGRSTFLLLWAFRDVWGTIPALILPEFLMNPQRTTGLCPGTGLDPIIPTLEPPSHQGHPSCCPGRIGKNMGKPLGNW